MWLACHITLIRIYIVNIHSLSTLLGTQKLGRASLCSQFFVAWIPQDAENIKNSPHTITPPPPAWTVGLGPWIHAVGTKFWPYHLRRVRCMYASAEIVCYLRMPLQKSIFIRPGFASLQLSSFGEPVTTTASAFGSWLTEVEPNVVLCSSSPSVSRFDVLRILRFFSADHNCTECLSELP